MKGFMRMCICFIMILTAGITFAGESVIITQQDKARTQCDIGVPCVFQVADYQFTAIATTDFVIPNVRDVNNMKAHLYCINTYTAKQKEMYSRRYKSHRVTQASLSVNETTITRKNRLHFDPGNC